MENLVKKINTFYCADIRATDDSTLIIRNILSQEEIKDYFDKPIVSDEILFNRFVTNNIDILCQIKKDDNNFLQLYGFKTTGDESCLYGPYPVKVQKTVEYYHSDDLINPVSVEFLTDFVDSIDKIDEDNFIYASVKIDVPGISTILHVTYRDCKLVGMAYTDIDAERFYEIKEGLSLKDLIYEVKNSLIENVTHNKENKSEQLKKLLKVCK